jgi:hypothetical protein
LAHTYSNLTDPDKSTDDANSEYSSALNNNVNFNPKKGICINDLTKKTGKATPFQGSSGVHIDSQRNSSIIYQIDLNEDAYCNIFFKFIWLDILI